MTTTTVHFAAVPGADTACGRYVALTASTLTTTTDPAATTCRSCLARMGA